MITQDDIDTFDLARLPAHKWKEVAEQLLKERDAYREVAIRLIKFGSGYELDDTLAEIGETLDAEAQRILESKG